MCIRDRPCIPSNPASKRILRAYEPLDSFKASSVSYTHLRAHETRHDLVCRLLLEKIKNQINPLEIKKRKIEEEIIQNNIQKDEILSQIDSLDLEKQKLFQGNQSKKETFDIKNKNLASNSAEINSLEHEIDLLIKTKSRLNNEQLRLEKDLSRFESRKEALNESRGSYALRILLEAGLELSLIHI